MSLVQQTGQVRRLSMHGLWSSRLGFILAVTGCAVGLGNIWKFPYLAGRNGGGAFVIVYLVCVVVIGLPVMMSEILIGRRGRRNPVGTMALLGEEEGSSRNWRIVGVMGVVSGILVLSYYCVIAGWALAYIPKSLSGAFDGATPRRIAEIYVGFVSDWRGVTASYTLFLAVAVAIVARGVVGGLERAVRFMMPALVILMLVLLVYAARSGAFAAGVSFMFDPDWSALTWDGVLQAMGQAFFTLSLGMGAIMAYGAYLPEDTPITQASAIVVAADTLIALLAGVVVFPLVFANGLDPAEGPGLVFLTLPIAFGKMAAGVVVATIFFVVLVFAAWTSALGLIEPAVAWVVENHGRSRAAASILVGGVIWVLGLGTALSFNLLADRLFLRGTFYANVEYLSANVLLPVGGLLTTIFAAWIMCRNSTSEELGGVGRTYRTWRFLARFAAPAAILLVFLRAVGVMG